MPGIGLGTWQLQTAKEADRQAVKSLLKYAYELGYRLIDTAAAYSNEIGIGKAIAEAGLFREELFLQNKVWNTCRGYSEVQEACKRSLKKMKTDYFDMYLIHWPASKKLYPNWAEINAETWRGMEQLYKDGWVKSIGVCNFKAHHLEELCKTAKIAPCVNQIELHPGMGQQETLGYCQEHGICVEASSPLGNGQILSNETLALIAKRHGKSAAQVCLRWAIQKGAVPIPKTARKERLKENMEACGFNLALDEMSMIDSIPYCGGIGDDPDEVTRFG